MVDLLYHCAPSPGSLVWLWEFFFIPSGSPLNLAGRFIHIWASYGYVVKASDVNQLQAFTLALCLYAGLNSKSSTQVTACATHL